MSFTNRMLQMLTGAYTQTSTSNIGKLFGMFGDTLDKLSATFEQLRAWNALQYASGTVLDRAGRNYGVARAGADDDTYRLMIRAKMMASFAGGDPDTLIRSAASLLSTADGDVYLVEGAATATLIINEADIPNEVFDRLPAVTNLLQQAAAAGVLLVLELQTPLLQSLYCGMILHDTEFLVIRQVN